jgi:hypothetical protein
MCHLVAGKEFSPAEFGFVCSSAEAETIVKRKWTLEHANNGPYLEFRSRILQARSGVFKCSLTRLGLRMSGPRVILEFSKLYRVTQGAFPQPVSPPNAKPLPQPPQRNFPATLCYAGVSA